MRVLLQPEVFTSQHQIELLVLAWLGRQGRHRIAPDKNALAAHDAWVAALDAKTRQFWTDMINASFQSEQFTPAHWEIAVTATGDAAWSHALPRVPIVEAVDLLMQPYRIVVENSINDKFFLLAVCGREEARELTAWENRGWLVFEMGGGATIAPRVEIIRKSDKLRRQASVLVDCDARRQPDPKKKEKKKHVEGDVASAVRKAAGNEVHWKSLDRRSIENYLTIIALRHWMTDNDKRRPVVKAFEALTPVQKNHYNMKHGFHGDSESAEKAGSLYERVDDDAKRHLHHGFGRHIADLFRHEVKLDHVDRDAHIEINTFVREILERMR